RSTGAFRPAGGAAQHSLAAHRQRAGAAAPGVAGALMITERELRQVAGRTGLGVGQTEHEYAVLCVLDALSQTSPLSSTFCLKGGTALRLLYFDDWRHSIDLDFSVLSAFPSEELRIHVEHWFDRVGVIHGVLVRLLDYHRANGAVRMRAQFLGPLRHPARLLFDITLDEPILLSPHQHQVVVSFFPALQPVVLTYGLEEILAEKMRTILQRGKARDYYDVWRLLKEKSADVDVALARSILGRKLAHKDVEMADVQAFLTPQHLEAAEAYWERDLAQQVAPQSLPDWAVVVEELEVLLTGLFG
ncbi:MAG: nucleotidyl transferase AbiEii/AbiGii toxin family protein, partial [bacterium]